MWSLGKKVEVRLSGFTLCFHAFRGDHINYTDITRELAMNLCHSAENVNYKY